MPGPTDTFTWNTGTSTWNTSANWTNAGSSTFVTGSKANSFLFVLGTGGGSPYTVTLGATAITAGAVDITSSNATLSITSGDTLKSGVGAAAGGDIAVSAGTLSMAGGIVEETTYTVSGSGLISGYGTVENQSTTATSLATSGSGAVLATGGSLQLLGFATAGEQLGLQGSFEIGGSAQSSVLELTDTSIASSAATFNFQNTDGTLEQDNTSSDFTVNNITNTDAFNGTLDNMAVGTVGNNHTGASLIDLQGQVVNSGSFASGTITVGTTGGTTFTFSTNQGSAVDVNWASDGSGGTDIWLDTNPCYAAGTRVLTDRGEVAVEQLAEGDMVVTLSGGTTALRPVRWIGQRRMNLRQHPRPNMVAPVRVRQHAFGENLPSRDLLVSPDHCLFVDGKLIPAKLLVNGMTIVQQRDIAAVHYYHVELDQHSVMFAEGLPAESYLDTGNRAMFANAGLALVMHPDFEINAHLKCWETDACAPLTIGQDAVKPIWDSLVERAESLGYHRAEFAAATTTDPELRLVADGRVLRPLSSDDGRYVFMLPAGVSSVRLTSRSSVPSDFGAYLDDWRALGVAVHRIVVRDNDGLTELPPDHPGLTKGWHRPERSASRMWRWTNGDAVLPIGDTAGPTMVEVHASAATKYILEDAPQGRLAA